MIFLVILTIAIGQSWSLQKPILTHMQPILVSPSDPQSVFITTFQYPYVGEFLQTWLVNSPPNSNIHLICNVSLPETQDCSYSSFTTIFDGKQGSVYCGLLNLESYFQTNSMLLMYRTSTQGNMLVGGNVNCIITARVMSSTGPVLSPHPPPDYKAVQSKELEDSTEHGVTETGKSPTCKCGWANKESGRIVNGTLNKPNEYPFIAGIVFTHNRTPFCGGAIISPKFVLTAAHCTDNILKKQISISVTVGEHDRSAGSPYIQIIRVLDIKQHEQYNPQLIENDISLLLLERPLSFTDKVGPVCLPKPGLNLVGEYIKIIGWGAQVFEGPMTLLPYKVDLRVIDRLACSYEWGHVSYARQTQICTYSKQKSACQGDSGGPVVYRNRETNRYTLAGLVSFGFNCLDVKSSVQTEVAAFLPWINYWTKLMSPEQLCEN